MAKKKRKDPIDRWIDKSDKKPKAYKAKKSIKPAPKGDNKPNKRQKARQRWQEVSFERQDVSYVKKNYNLKIKQPKKLKKKNERSNQHHPRGSTERGLPLRQQKGHPPWIPKGRNHSEINLEEEIGLFCAFVKLSQKERSARQTIIQSMRDFSNREVSIFGSFAVPEVCTFYSDIDVVIPCQGLRQEADRYQEIQQQREERKAAKRQREPTEEEVSRLLKKQRKERWSLAMDEALKEQSDAKVDPQRQAYLSMNGKDDSDQDDADPLVTSSIDRRRSASICSEHSFQTKRLGQWAEQHEDEQEEPAIHVVSSSSSSSEASLPELTVRTKRHARNSLFAFRKLMNKSGQFGTIEMIMGAKVPIIKCITRVHKIHIDIGVDGHAGMNTRYVAQQYVEEFPTLFAPLVLILKVLLHQHGFDEPFNGGLGSYKLYLLVAAHLKKTTQDTSPSEALILFLRRYCNPNLRQGICTLANGIQVDLSAVRKLRDICKLFSVCHQALVSQPHLKSVLRVGEIRSDRGSSMATCGAAK